MIEGVVGWSSGLKVIVASCCLVLVGCATEDEPLPGGDSSQSDAHDDGVVGDAPDSAEPDDAAPSQDEDADDPVGEVPEGEGAGHGGCAQGELALACSTMVEFIDDAQLLMDDLFGDDDCRLVTVQGAGVTAAGTVDPRAPSAYWRVIYRCDGRDVVLRYANADGEATDFPTVQAYVSDAALPHTWEGLWLDSDELMSRLDDEGCIDPAGDAMEVTLHLTTEGPELALYVVHQGDVGFSVATDESGAQLGSTTCG